MGLASPPPPASACGASPSISLRSVHGARVAPSTGISLRSLPLNLASLGSWGSRRPLHRHQPAEPPPQSRFARFMGLASPPPQASACGASPSISLRSVHGARVAPSTGQACGASPSISLRSFHGACVAPSTGQACGASPSISLRSFHGACVAPSTGQACGASPSISLRSFHGACVAPSTGQACGASPSISLRSFHGACVAPSTGISLRSLPLNLASLVSWGLRRPLPERSPRSLPFSRTAVRAIDMWTMKNRGLRRPLHKQT